MVAKRRSHGCSEGSQKKERRRVDLPIVDNTYDAIKPVSTAAQDALDSAWSKTTAYTRTDVYLKLFDIIEGAPEALTTLEVFAKALGSDQ